ncbi:MAG: hypothetical protein R2877_02870 [Bdellovibrionota bacterium]
MTQYAAFVSARAFQVYGESKSSKHQLPQSRQPSYTNEGQTIAEAAAEAVI